MDTTLVRLLDAEAIPFAELHRRYGSVLALVRALIGVVPNCDPYLEIWPTAFRTYNVMVPNFLNLPFSLWGVGAPKDVVGLAMYASSRTAECMYCAAHTCSFALRRGARPDKVAGILGDASLSPGEQAAVAVARSLSRLPSSLSDAERRELARHFSPAEAEWIVLGVVMMGFLNKFMDATGVKLEASTVEEVRGLIGPSGWTPGKHLHGQAIGDGGTLPPADGLGTKLGVLPYVPSALSLDRQWTSGVPDRWPAVGAYLRRSTGHDFPVLRRVQRRRALRAIAVMLRDNLDPEASVTGIDAKLLAGFVYATLAADATLATDLRALAHHRRLAPEVVDRVVRFAMTPSADDDLAPLDARTQALVRLARAASPSPSEIPDSAIDACTATGLGAAAIVELICFLSVMQMLHRLSIFYAA